MSNCVLCTLCCHTSFLVVIPVVTSGITVKYPMCCGQLSSDPVRIRYRAGHMTILSKPLPPPPRSLCIDPKFVFSLELYQCMSLYVGIPSTLVRKTIGKYKLVSVTFYMVLYTHFVWCSLAVSSTL